jgi:hypothetical protein
MKKENTTNQELANGLDKIEDNEKNILKSFIFQNKKILAQDESTLEDEAETTIEAFEAINNHASILDGIESIAVQGTNGRVDIIHINDYYLTLVTSKEADETALNNLTHVLAPDIFKKAQDVVPISTNTFLETNAKISVALKTDDAKPILVSEPLELPEPDQLTPEYDEFIVDDIGRIGIISSSSDLVRLDIVTVGRWTELYGENKILKVIIQEANTRKTFECKYEVSKDTKQRIGVVLIPEPIQRKLLTKKGAKVLIKPIIRQESLENMPIEEPKSAASIFLPNSPACQLIVEDISGFGGFSGAEMVRFDQGLSERWKELYGETRIEEITITDTVSGKTMRCKFKIVKDSNFTGKGIIQVSKSIRKQLAIKEGSLVTVKPVLS